MNAQTQITAQSQQSIGLLNLEAFELSQRIAKMLSSSTLVPEQYRATIQKKAGKDQHGNQQWREEPNPNGLANCVIALNMSNRMGADPLMVMQNLYLVNGRPSWSSQFIMAGINGSGRFSALRFELKDLGEKEVEYTETVWENRQKKNITKTIKIHDFSCIAWAIEKETGERLESSKITIEMAVKEGWYTKDGSKWQTMSEQMLRYRSASFFGRVYAPELLMGLRSAEEEQDRIIDVTPVQETVVNASDFKNIKSLILKAKSLDDLEELESSIYALSNESERDELIKFYKASADKYKVAEVEATELKKPEPVKEDAPPIENVVEVKITAKPSEELRKEYSLRMNKADSQAELNEILEIVLADEHLTKPHAEYLRSVHAQCKEKFVPKKQPAEAPKVDVKSNLLRSIANAQDIPTLERVAKQITTLKKDLAPGNLNDVLAAYAQRKEIISQADIFDNEPEQQMSYVESAIKRIQNARSQDDINDVYADPAFDELSGEDRERIDQEAQQREAELQD